MFVVVYRFKVKTGQEENFKRGWAERTLEIRAGAGGLGSRLHRADDGTWVAYAQWPDRGAWETSGDKIPLETPSRVLMSSAVEGVETLFCMEVVSDLLIH